MTTKKINSGSLLMVAIVSLTVLSCEKSEEDKYGPSKNLIFHETFENGDPFSTVHNRETGDWDYALQYVDSIAQDGNYSARFEIREEQPLVAQGKRSEVTVIMSTNETLTKKAWYSFAVYFPATFAADTTYDVISQWYNDGSSVRLLVKSDRLFLEVGADMASKDKILIGDLTRETWHEFIFKFYHSPFEDGNVTVWHNGKATVSRRGGNVYTDALPKWKIGIYKSSFEEGTSTVQNRVVYFDNVKVGNEFASYRDMEPTRP